MSKFDYGNFAWVSSQADLAMSHSFAQVARGVEPLYGSPLKAGFFWKRSGQLVWSVELAYEELAEVIYRLESERLATPSEFQEALRGLNMHQGR